MNKFKLNRIIQATLIFIFLFISSCDEKIIETDKSVSTIEETGIKINKEQQIVDLDNSGVTLINAIDTIEYYGQKLPEYEVTVKGSIEDLEEIKAGTIVNIPCGDKGGILLFVTNVKADENKSANTAKGTGVMILEGFQATLDMYFNYENAILEFSTPGNRAKENLDIPNKIADNTIDYLDIDVKFKIKNKDEDTKISFSSTPTQLCKLGFSSKIWQSDDTASYVAFKGSIGIQPAMDFYMHYEPVINQSAGSKLLGLLESAVVPNAVLLAYKDQNYYLGNMKQLTANFYASINRDLEIKVHLAKEFERKDPYSIPLGTVVIPTVPVSAQIELSIEFDPKAAGSVDLSIYDKLKSDIAFGIDLDRDLGEPKWYFESNQESDGGLELKAKVELTAGVYLVLSTEAYVIGIIGPEIKVGGGVEGKAMVEGNIGTSTAPSASWQLKADWVVKAEAKLNLSAFHVDKATWIMWNKAFLKVKGNIYTAPDHLEIISGNNQSGTLGQALNNPVEIGVYDNFNNLIKYLPVPVYFETDNGGSFSDNPVISGSGIATVGWTLGNTDKTQNMSAYFMVDGNKSDTVKINATGIDGGGTAETGTLTYGGKTYKTVTINGKEWMAENLAYLPVVHPVSSESYTEARYYVYGYNGSDVATAKQQANYARYGVLYNWPAAKAACPPGWHLPSDAEWTELQNYLIANGFNYDGTTTGNKIAKSLAATTNWNTSSRTGAIGNNLSLNNKSGFSGLPGGFRHYNNDFTMVEMWGFWWSSTEYDPNHAWHRSMSYDYSDLAHVRSYGKENGFSVRCVRD